MRDNWHGILEVLEIQHIRNGQVIWSKSNIKNVLHSQGEEYFLRVLFSSDAPKPDTYYFGLDARTDVAVDDTLESLVDEPSNNNGYTRQAIDTTGWVFGVSGGVNQAKSPIITFSASGGRWGPVSKLFLTDQPEGFDPTEGHLISTVDLGTDVSVVDGDAVSLRMAVKLRDCS